MESQFRGLQSLNHKSLIFFCNFILIVVLSRYCQDAVAEPKGCPGWHPWHRIGHPGCHPKNVYATISFSLFNHTEISIYFSLELKDVSMTRLVFRIALRLVYFQPPTSSRATCLFTEWKTSQSREDIDNELTDTTEKVTYNNMKQSLIIQFLLISNYKNSFGAVKWLVWRIMRAFKFKRSRSAFLLAWSKHWMNIRSMLKDTLQLTECKVSHVITR